VDSDFSDDAQSVQESLETNPDDQAEPAREKSLELLPVIWAIATPSSDRKLATNEVWDDTGWRSEQ
jgi:hypothetical protein